MKRKKTITDLFKKHDYVVITLREDGEITQNRFIEQIIRSPFFTDSIHYIFTDKAAVNQSEIINKALSSSNKKDLLKVCRNTTSEVCCGYYNFYQFLENLRKHNKKSSAPRKITLIPVDIEWNWDNITDPEQYSKATISARRRDSLITQNIIRICETKNINKALILLREDRAIHFPESSKWDTTFLYTNGQKEIQLQKNRLHSSTYDDLNNYWKNKITNVLLNNSVTPYSKNTFQEFHSSPSGNDTLIWKYPIAPNVYDICKIPYRDIFDYYIYYNNPEEFIYVSGIPGILDKEFSKEFNRRLSVIGYKPDKAVYKYYNQKKIWRTKRNHILQDTQNIQ